MTSRQRLLATITGNTADRLPCAPHFGVGLIDQMTAAEWQALREQTDVTLNVGGLDDIAIFGGQRVLDTRRSEQEGTETTTTIDTPLGPLRSRRVKTPEANWQAEPWCTEPGDVDRLLSIDYAEPGFDMNDYHEWCDRLGDDGLVALGIPSAIRFCLAFYGPQRLYLTMADTPDVVERLVAAMNERLVLYVRACCENGVRSFWMGGSEHCGPGVVHPRLFARYVEPYDRAVVEVIHAHGGIVNYHTHGRLRDILDAIVRVGVDVLSPVETGLRGDVTLAEAKALVDGAVCLKGNLDDMAFLALASVEEARAAAQACVDEAAAGGGLILSGTDAGVYSPEWVANFLVLAEVAAAYRY